MVPVQAHDDALRFRGDTIYTPDCRVVHIVVTDNSATYSGWQSDPATLQVTEWAWWGTRRYETPRAVTKGP